MSHVYHHEPTHVRRTNNNHEGKKRCIRYSRACPFRSHTEKIIHRLFFAYHILCVCFPRLPPSMTFYLADMGTMANIAQLRSLPAKASIVFINIKRKFSRWWPLQKISKLDKLCTQIPPLKMKRLPEQVWSGNPNPDFRCCSLPTARKGWLIPSSVVLTRKDC